MTRRSPVPPGAWPTHYTADEIAVAIKDARIESGISLADLARMIGSSPSPVCQVLAGTYKDQPARFLNRMAAALGLPRPAAWARLPMPTPSATATPAPEPTPEPAPAAPSPRKPSRPRYGCWEPGEAQADANAPVRAAILRELAHTCSANPLAVQDLIDALGQANGTPKTAVVAALGALTEACQVVRATVIRKRRRVEVVYLIGRVPGIKLQHRRVQITPSNHANSVHRGTYA